MATGLDVWIAKPGSACRVDDQAWKVTVYDAHNQVFQWASITYADLPAPKAHWTGSIPPGTYVVRAVSSKGVSTDHAIAVVDCGEVACVRLFVAAPGRQEPPRPQQCRVTVTEVVGLVSGGNAPSAIQVTGTAIDCSKVRVTVSCTTGETSKADVAVGAGGLWTAILKDIRQLECRCGGSVTVVARCADHPECVTQFEADDLRCRPRKEDVPK